MQICLEMSICTNCIHVLTRRNHKRIVFVYKHMLLHVFMERCSESKNERKKSTNVFVCFLFLFHELLDQPSWHDGIASTSDCKVDLVLKVL